MTMQTLLTLRAPAAAPVSRVAQPVANIASPGTCRCEDMNNAFVVSLNASNRPVSGSSMPNAGLRESA